MLTEHVIAHYGSKAAVAAALGIATPSLYSWKERPPPMRQLQLEALTEGRLKADPECDKFRFPPAPDPAEPAAAAQE